MDILEFIKKMQEMYGEDVITTADKIKRPEPKPIVKEIEAFNEFMRRNPKADGGQLVAPSVDGSRPGYSGKDAYTINRDKKRAEAKEKGKVYDLKTKRFRKSKVPVSQYGAGATRDMKEYMKQYYKDTKEYTETGKLEIERKKKLKEFIGKKKKISSTALRDFVINELGYSRYRAAYWEKKYPNLEIVKDIKYRPDATPLTKQQKTIIMENFDLPKGVEKWDFKQHKYGISNTKYTRLYDQIKNRLDDKIKYKVAGNFSLPKGWMMNAMNRLYENETVLKDGKRVLKEGVKKLTYEPIKNKRGIIVGFKDNTAAGKNNIYYATEKSANQFGDGTAWTAHGDYNRISKFVDIANGVKAEPNKVLQKILTQKGINVPGLTLNNVLSHQRYYSTLAETRPSELIKRQIVLHHTKGVGDQNLARAAATKDIQLLTGEINSKVMKLENIVKGTSITPGRKLNADEIAKLKNYGAKILDFDGKIVGGGYVDPERQFANIEKQALKYAKSDKFNVKTVNSYLERLGCGKAAGGRILMSNGGATLTKCAQKGSKRLEQILLKGGANKNEQILANSILRSGKFLKDAVSLRGLFGPAALAFTAAAEAGIVGYDMLSEGKTFKEAVGDSVFNYALGPKLKIDSIEERNKRFRKLGVSEKDMGKIAAFESALSDIDRIENIFAKNQTTKQKLEEAKKFFPAVVDKRQKEVDAVRADIQDLARTGTEQRLMNVDYDAGAKALEEAKKLATIDRLTSRGPQIFGQIFPKAEKSRQQRILDASSIVNPAHNIPGMREATGGYLYGFASGGLANLTNTIPPESGPMSQGLRSLYNNGKKL